MGRQHDVMMWSPQGRLHQVEYAMEAVKQVREGISVIPRQRNLL
jgi:20S proteasome alpha/beta subunit